MITLAAIAFGSPAYAAALELRQAVLRTPLSLVLSAADTAGEDTQQHFGTYAPDGVLVGCVVLRPLPGGGYRLRQMAVAPAHQRQGIGRLLVQGAETWARAAGATHIELHARVTAVPFYQRLGYTLDHAASTWLEVTIPHQQMAKRLA